MKSRYSKRAVQIAWLLTLVYFASYLMRKNFEIMADTVLVETGWAKSALSVIVVGMAVCYGIGQLVSGFLGDRISPCKLVTVGLWLAFGCNVTMAFCSSLPAMCAVWGVNGVAHSLLWPPIVALLCATLNTEEYAYASVRVSWGSSLATVFLYFFCSSMLRVVEWRTVLLFCAGGGLILTVLWSISSPRLFGDVAVNAKSLGGTAARAPLPKFMWVVVALIMFAIVLQGMLRDGVSGWMPTVLRESFRLSSEDSIFLSAGQAALSILSFSLFGKLQQRLVHNELAASALIFLLGVLSAVGLLLLPSGGSVVTVAGSVLFMSVLCGCMHGVNLMLIGFVPRQFAKTGRVSFFSGLLNACTYVGTAAGYFLFALLSGDGDWHTTIISWVVIGGLGALLCAALIPQWQRYRNTDT